MERGLLMAFTAVFFWGLLDAGSRYAVVALGADPWVFSCLNLVVGAAILLMIAGRGSAGLETIHKFHTWIFGFFRVLMTLFLVFAFTVLSASEANFMLRINVVMGMAVAWLLFKRTPSWTDAPGVLLLVGGFSTLVWNQGDAQLYWAVGLVVAAAACDTVLTVVAETHPTSRKASGLHARCRYTGFVLLVTALFFFVIAMLLAFTGNALSSLTTPGSAFAQVMTHTPQLADFVHVPTWVASILIGSLLRAPSMYLYLYAARLLKTENLMMAATLAPFATLGAESFFVAAGVLEAPTLDMLDVAAGVTMTFGALSMVLTRMMRSRKEIVRP